jgi:hypothetical protein
MNTNNTATLGRNIKVSTPRPCTIHATRPAAYRMSYLFTGTRKNHYDVCLECHQEFSRGETLVEIRMYEVRP